MRTSTGAPLPLQTPPLVFALSNGDGTTDNMWGIDADSKLHVVALNESSEECEDVHRRAAALSNDDMRSADWTEDDMDELFATMGNDEVGYGFLVRQQANVTTSLD